MVFLVALCAALGCGLVAGVFVAFSTFVMPALAALPAAAGVAAMQAINVAAINRWFMGLLFGTAAACLAVAVTSWRAGPAAAARLRIAGVLFYLVGAIGVTIAFNVPRNDALAAVRPDSVEAAALWTRYLAEWVAWNHVRASASIAAAMLLTLGLVPSRPGGRLLAGMLLAMHAGGCNADQVHPIAAPGTSTPVDRLSALGLFAGAPAAQVPAAGLIAYDVNVSLYADGAEKRRFVRLPPGARVHVTADLWDLPVGTYLVKTFSFPVDARDPSQGERLVETRFLVKTAGGYVSSTYLWNAEQTDAFASAGNVDVPVTWVDREGARHQDAFHVPGTSQCPSCHAGRALGWRSRQLDRHTQLARFAALGIIDGRPPLHTSLADPFGGDPLDVRARGYLDVHCGSCHEEGGLAERTNVYWNLGHTNSRDLPNCRPTRAIGGRDRVLVPGRPAASEFLARMVSPDPDEHMPRGPNRLVDRAGVALLTAWVAAMPPTTCADDGE